MSVLRHPNIVMFLGACSDPPCMVTEYCARGSLLDILTRARESQVCLRPGVGVQASDLVLRPHAWPHPAEKEVSLCTLTCYCPDYVPQPASSQELYNMYCRGGCSRLPALNGMPAG